MLFRSEALAGVRAAADFLHEHGLDAIADYETAVFAPLLEGLQSMRGVRVLGPADLVDRAPTVAFTIDGIHPDDAVRSLAERRIATWSGDSYAVEVAAQLGIAGSGGAVRAGVARYVTPDDVQRLLEAVAEIAGA